jgi:L-histidine N-alpha-methyltransferase
MHQATARQTDLQETPFAQDVRRDLSADPKRLSAQYFYDALGSALFDSICELPWYQITRAEERLLDRHAEEIARQLRDPAFIVELGPGNGAKLARVARALGPRAPRPRVHLIDVSVEALDEAQRTLTSLKTVDVTVQRDTYEAGLRGLAASRNGRGSAIVLFLGSNIGNFHPDESAALLREIRHALSPGGRLLLGTDLVKPESELLAAYDDPLGVTAAFNKNLLLRINRELGANFDLGRFDHRAVWRRTESRVEMHLVSKAAHDVHIPDAGCRIHFDAGETIWTESSYKFDPAGVCSLGRRAGFDASSQWIDDEARFALTLFRAV